LDRVVELCELAIEKGLDEEGKAQANELLSSAAFDYAKQLCKMIFRQGPPDNRWKLFRREALKRLERVIEIRPDKVEALILVARLHGLAGGDRDKAMEAIESAVEKITDDQVKLSEALFVRATLSTDEEAMLADLSQAIKIDTTNADALRVRGGYYLQHDKVDEAMEDFRAWLQTDPENLDRYIIVGDSLRVLKKYEQAIEIMDKAIEVNSNDARVYALRGQIHSENEQLDLALNDLNKSIELNRQNAEALLIRASILLENEDYEMALNDANEALQQEPENPRGLWVRSVIYGAKEDYQKAIKDVEVLVQDYPTSVEFKSQLGMLYNANEQPTEAIKIYNSILRYEPEDARVLRGRGDANLSLGEHKKAIEDYEAALDALPSDDDEQDEPDDRISEQRSGILNNLAWVLATSPKDDLRNGKRSIELATEASELTDYKKAFILSTLASGYAEVGDFETAIKWATKAVELAEDEEQRGNLTNELESYKRNEPWRELENVEEKKKQQAEEAAKQDDKSGDDKSADEKSDEDKSDSGKSDSDKSADDKSDDKQLKSKDESPPESESDNSDPDREKDKDKA
jgi:tetratricopeptide (TPR) repeat protein